MDLLAQHGTVLALFLNMGTNFSVAGWFFIIKVSLAVFLLNRGDGAFFAISSLKQVLNSLITALTDRLLHLLY